MDDAEAMFFVDDHQAEILELHVFLQQPVGSDNNIDNAFGGLLQYLRDLFRRQKPADHFDAHRVIAKAMAKGLQMLLRQDRRRRQHGHLLSAFDGEKCRAHRDFGLAVTDVAADQAIHRFSALHAREGLIDGPLLIGGFFIFEGGFEFSVQIIRRREGISCPRFPKRVELYQLFGHGEDRLARLRFDFLPGGAP